MKILIPVYILIVIFLVIFASVFKKNTTEIKKVFLDVQKNKVNDIFITSMFRPDPNHNTAKALDFNSKSGASVLSAYEYICNKYNDVRLGIGILNADRHIHIDLLGKNKNCKKRFIETSKISSYCVDNLTCSQIIENIKFYYNY